MESYLVAALKIFSCSMRTLSHNMWDLIPRAEIEPSTPALRARGLSHWTTREILCYHLLSYHPQSLAPCSSLPCPFLFPLPLIFSPPSSISLASKLFVHLLSPPAPSLCPLPLCQFPEFKYLPTPHLPLPGSHSDPCLPFPAAKHPRNLGRELWLLFEQEYKSALVSSLFVLL